jgi:hypothetical protein
VPAGCAAALLGPHAKEAPSGLYKLPAPRDLLRPSRRHLRCFSPGNPSTAAFGFLPPPSSRRRGAVQGLRLEVSNAPVPLVIEFVLRRDWDTSPEFMARAAASTGRSAASSPRPPSQLASRARTLHVDAFRASNRAPEP